MNIVLIGMSGVGKSTVGKLLASRLERPFSDTDEVIERRHGDISKIFEIMGQEKFRQWEKEAVKAESMRKNIVIATGGGVVTDEENVAALKADGTLVYLRANVQTLEERLRGGMERPLLAGEKREQLKELFKSRELLYEGAADFTVDTDGTSAEEVAKSIQRLLRGMK